MAKNDKTEDPQSGEALARRCVDICENHKAENIQLYDVTGASMITDFYLICSGSSEPHIRALHNHLKSELAEAGVAAAHVDGGPSSRWIVIDFGTVLVHIFHPELRRYYEIEALLGQDRLVYRSNEPAATQKPSDGPRFRFDLAGYKPPEAT
jgi:ribosome-associated protein